MVAGKAGGNTLAPRERRRVLRGGRLLAEDEAAQSDTEKRHLVGLSPPSAVSNRELEQWPDQPVDYRAINVFDTGRSLRPLDECSPVYRYFSLH